MSTNKYTILGIPSTKRNINFFAGRVFNLVLGTPSTKTNDSLFGRRGLNLVLGIGILTFFFLPYVVFAQDFTRDLKVGDSGEDVLLLQQILNQTVQTKLAEAGPGSPGQETEYFGPITANAVARYQNLYAAEILAPLGLFSGTGYFGASTRAHINEGPLSNERATEDFVEVAPKITDIIPKKGGVGTEVTLYGDGFVTAGNFVGSALEEWGDIASYDRETLTFIIKGPFPQEFLKENEDFYKEEKFEMEYQIGVINKNGRSNFVPFVFTFY